MSNIFNYPPNQTPAEKEKMMTFGRSIYSFIITKLLRKSLSESDLEFKKSLRGIAWSVMAKDIEKTLGPKGQKPLSSEWREQMRKIIFSDKPDMKQFKSELKKFEMGNKEVFFQQTVIPPQSRVR